MQLWRSLEEVPTDLPATAVAIGVFDGVHAGHRAVLAALATAAGERGLRPVAVTFDPHPAAVVRPDAAPALLTTVETRAALLHDAGADAVLALPFTTRISRLAPAEFVDVVLVATLHARHVVVGENFRFGHRAAGDVHTLTAEGERRGFTVQPLALVAGQGEPVSSTATRAAVAAGDVAAAAALLGRPHRVEGLVVRGAARGRDLGYPTANVAVAPGTAVPADGVYAGRLVRAGGERLPAAVSVGTNPTFDGRERTVEAYVLDADLDLYGEHVAVEFVQRLRGMERFADADALVAQMQQDVEQTRRILLPGGEPAPR